MQGFTYNAGAFFIFLLIVLLTTWAFASWIRAVAAIAPSPVIASAVRLGTANLPSPSLLFLTL